MAPALEDEAVGVEVPPDGPRALRAVAGAAARQAPARGHIGSIGSDHFIFFLSFFSPEVVDMAGGSVEEDSDSVLFAWYSWVRW